MRDQMQDVQRMIDKLQDKQHKKNATEYIQTRQEVDKVSVNTLKCDMQAITYLSRYLKNKPFQKVTRDDMRNWSTWMMKQKVKHGTTMDVTTRDLHSMKVKRFYKYIADKEKYQNGKADQRDIKYPDAVRWISYNAHDDDELPLESIINDKQVKKLLDACEDIRQRVIIISFLDAGLRLSELISLKYKNIGFEPQLGYYYILPKKQKGKGQLKTGMRKVQLFLIPSSSLYIKQYINEHLYRDDPESPFIYSMDVRRKWTKSPLSEKGLREIFNRIVKRSGLQIHLTPHILRHNSATRCVARGFSEPMLRERYGWRKNSAMPSRYVHLAQTDIDNKIKQILGIKTEDTTDVSILQPITCPNCEYANVPTNVVCGRCGMKLSITNKDIVTASDVGMSIESLLDEPDFLKKVIDKLSDRLEQITTGKK